MHKHILGYDNSDTIFVHRWNYYRVPHCNEWILYTHCLNNLVYFLKMSFYELSCIKWLKILVIAIVDKLAYFKVVRYWHLYCITWLTGDVIVRRNCVIYEASGYFKLWCNARNVEFVGTSQQAKGESERNMFYSEVTREHCACRKSKMLPNRHFWIGCGGYETGIEPRSGALWASEIPQTQPQT